MLTLRRKSCELEARAKLKEAVGKLSLVRGSMVWILHLPPILFYGNLREILALKQSLEDPAFWSRFF